MQIAMLLSVLDHSFTKLPWPGEHKVPGSSSQAATCYQSYHSKGSDINRLLPCPIEYNNRSFSRGHHLSLLLQNIKAGQL